ncbi:minor capsid protein [Streptococcus dysgalactiae]|uniref:minor capsid protein n=1 Tax=Streptococcus dysgalactiae TaxID=1334 RepID=UPI0010CACC53|nr:minor capsid protein [Streptococcus dysgalactiae]VTS29827.1 phage protein [Streptococcus dysgalactiae subsp. equisimilis]
MAKIVVELGGIKRKVSPQALAKGKLVMNNQVMMSMNPYVPYRDGALRGSSRANSVSVTRSGPHARAQFYGGAYNKYRSFKFKKYTTPGTGKRWDKRALANATIVKDWEKSLLRGMGFK